MLASAKIRGTFLYISIVELTKSTLFFSIVSLITVISSFFLYIINFVPSWSYQEEFSITLAFVSPELLKYLVFVSPEIPIEPSNIILLFSNTVPIKVYLNADLNKKKNYFR